MKKTTFGIGKAAIVVAALAVPLIGAVAATGKLSPAQAEQGRQVFTDNMCGTCHVLADAEGEGAVGPSLDGHAALTREAAIAAITDGKGAMPGFGGQLSDEEIALLSDYLLQAKK